MKPVFKRTVLLGTVVLAALVATSRDFSSPLHRCTHQVTVPSQTYELHTQQWQANFSTRIARRFVVINTTLATLQAGIFGNSRAKGLRLTCE